MDNIHHKTIKRFFLSGNIYDDSTILKLKTEYIRLLVSEMNLSGYVPRFDIDPDFTISYNEKVEIFEFKLSIYGTYVGKKKVKWIIGLDGTKVIYTQKSKSKEFLQDQCEFDLEVPCLRFHLFCE
jgi:hypothetical protein